MVFNSAAKGKKCRFYIAKGAAYSVLILSSSAVFSQVPGWRFTPPLETCWNLGISGDNNGGGDVEEYWHPLLR